MAMNLNQFSELTNVVYQATLDHSKWSEFVSKLSYITGVSQSYMIAVGHETQVPFSPVTPNLAPEFFDNYNEHYCRHDLWISSMPTLAMGRVWESDDVLGRRRVEQSMFYNEWLRPQEDILKGLAMVVARNSARAVVLGANIRRIDKDQVNDNWVDTVKALAPHIRQAFSMSTIVGQDKFDRLAGMQGQARKGVSAVLVVSAQANLIYANETAHGFLDDNKIIATGLGGADRFVDVNCALQFRTALEGLKENAPNVSRICLDVDVALGPYEVRMAKLDPFDPPIPFSISIGEPALLVTIGRQLPNDNALANLQSKFSLTFAEAAVIDGFSAGKPLRAISEEKQVSIHTVRNQMKAAMAKLGVRSQIELMAFLQRL